MTCIFILCFFYSNICIYQTWYWFYHIFCSISRTIALEWKKRAHIMTKSNKIYNDIKKILWNHNSIPEHWAKSNRKKDSINLGVIISTCFFKLTFLEWWCRILFLYFIFQLITAHKSGKWRRNVKWQIEMVQCKKLWRNVKSWLKKFLLPKKYSHTHKHIDVLRQMELEHFSMRLHFWLLFDIFCKWYKCNGSRYI